MKKPEKIEILHDARGIAYIQGDNENDYKIGRVADIVIINKINEIIDYIGEEYENKC